MEENKGFAEVVERKDGYYWVKFNGTWHIAYYFIEFGDDWWSFPLIADIVKDEYFSEIDERQICRS